MNTLDEAGPTYEEERTKTVLVLLRCLRFEPIGAEQSLVAKDVFLRGCRQQRIADLCDILLSCMNESIEAVRSYFGHLLNLSALMGYLMILHMATDTVANYLMTLSHFIGNDGFSNMSDFIRADQASGLQKLMMDVTTCLRDFQRQIQAANGALGVTMTPSRDFAGRLALGTSDSHRGSTNAQWLTDMSNVRTTTAGDYAIDPSEMDALQALLDHCRQTLENFYLLMTEDADLDSDIQRTARGYKMGFMGGLREKEHDNGRARGGKQYDDQGSSSSDGEIFDRVIVMLKQVLSEPSLMQPPKT
eukprot:Blabericola_migrator_1__7829@NODE_3_length_32604_cov_133_371700_g2_i0_p10_GENE_NODE_3_length_32604_cov_133_371700_g2_i0NODE_3_length_32604_cov_133_371700_g2_i0_p10_ORF_typecomplete_len303_score33_34RMI1_C/PF16099_5/12RMI1_C/PF16099_5/28_NODE_3_length_32604_cov_133_371700_g2_i047145622